MNHEQTEVRAENFSKATENAAATALSNESQSLSKSNTDNVQAQKQESKILPGLEIVHGEKPSEANQGLKSHAENERKNLERDKSAENRAESKTDVNKHGSASDSAACHGAENTAQGLTNIPKTEVQGLAKPDLWKDGKLDAGGGSSATPDYYKNGQLQGDVQVQAKPDHL